MSDPDALALFHPLVAEWFRAAVGEPTPVQQLAWPVIAGGEHALVSAPTGSGKTLTAFLWALDRLIREASTESTVTGDGESRERTGGVRVLYVSPLKALGADIRNNLTGPLEQLRRTFRAAGEPFPGIAVSTRSGDTPQNERRRMLRQPPEILITTPESLNLLISARSSRAILTGVETVILDEIHAVVDGKRGVHLMTAVERLALLAGEFQRIALSATVRPLDLVAAFIGGLRQASPGTPATHATPAKFEPRPVRVIEAPRTKEYRISVHFPLAGPARAGRPPANQKPAETAKATGTNGAHGTAEPEEPTVWESIVGELFERIRAARSTLVFANNRRLSEQLARMLNDREPGIAYAHHGSLSRELRRVVEHRLKKGELACVVATSSLELGIDVGSLDQVLLVETPRSIASAIQRVGRAGHGVGEISRGRLYPSHGRDLLEAAVIGRAIQAGAIEPVRPVHGALDVLAQVILAMLGMETWEREKLFAFFRTCYPYRELSREQFDLVLDMLRGRYERSRVRELKARIALDEDGTVLRAREGVLRLVYSSGGTIPDRGYYDLRTADTRARIGSLDEEFVWERSLGDAFVFGVGTWRVTRITHNDVEVVPAGEQADLLPFWRAESLNRSYFFSERIGAFLQAAEENGLGPDFVRRLQDEYGMDAPAANSLDHWLTRQQEATGKLPHLGRVVAEQYRDPAAPASSLQIIAHTHWGGRVNRPLALALSAACEERFGEGPEYFANDDCINLLLPEELSFRDVLDLAAPERLEELLRRKLEATGFFGARFRENAGRALLLPRSGFKQRTPLWMNRRRSKKLLEEVQAAADFPLVVETWRTCLNDEFDLENLQKLYQALASGAIELHEVRTAAPSPFAADVIWRQVNQMVYADDRPRSAAGPSLSETLFREMVAGTRLRPRLPEKVIDELTGRLQRLAPGYAPAGALEILDWLSERVVLPLSEWALLARAIFDDTGNDAADLLRKAGLHSNVFRLPAGEKDDGDETRHVLVTRARLPEVLFVRCEETPAEADSLRVAGEAVAALTSFDGTELDESERAEIAAYLERSWRSFRVEPARPALVAEWLQYYGPVVPDHGEGIFAEDPEGWRAAVRELAEARTIIEDSFREGSDDEEICDAENLEILLRLARRRAVPDVRTRPIGDLPWFLANWQGLVRREPGLDGARNALESLFGFAAPASVWESDLLPARVAEYRGLILDALFQESDLVWYGAGREQIAFAFAEELRLFRDGESNENAGEAESVVGLLPDPAGRYDFFELQSHSGKSRQVLGEELWRAVWAGRISNTGYSALRRGLAGKFKVEEVSRGGRGRWQSSRPMPGLWFGLPHEQDEPDALAREEDRKQKARQMLNRYGVLFRELAAQEVPALRWSELFRALRIMELSGEIVAGYFFEGVAGPQFMTPGALRLFRNLPAPALFWISAVDPVSPCGLGLAGFKGSLPRRLPGNHLVYAGAELILISESRGRRLEFRVGPEDARARGALEMFRTFLNRPEGAFKMVSVETINATPAAESAYSDMMREAGFRKEMKKLVLNRSYETSNFVDIK